MDVEIVKKAAKLKMTAHGNLEKAITARIECRTEEDGDGATSCGMRARDRVFGRGQDFRGRGNERP